MDKNKNSLIDPITLSLIRNSLSSIADEMATTIVRTAYSTVIRDCMDFSTALCDEEKHVDIPEREHPLDDYTIAELDKYQENWEIIH